MRSTKRNASCIFVTLAIFVVASLPARADLWGASANSSDGPLHAQASFTITKGEIDVTITNLLDPTKIKSAGQAVSELIFTISNAPGKDSTNTASGKLVNVGSGGSLTSVSGTPGRWIGLEKSGKKVLGGFNITGDTITLETIGGGKPTELILPWNAGGKYTSANASITQNFSPFVDGPATFVLHLAGVTTSTKIKDVTFGFGTSPDHTVSGTYDPPKLPIPTPEPSTLAIATVAGLGLFAYRLEHERAG